MMILIGSVRAGGPENRLGLALHIALLRHPGQGRPLPQGSAQNRANLYAKPFASHETAVELVLAVEEDVVPPDRAVVSSGRRNTCEKPEDKT